MIGLDTDVLVRALTGDDPEQSATARAFMRSLASDGPGFVSLVALMETWWVLRRGEHYRYSREQALAVVRALLGSAGLVVENGDLVREAVSIAMRTGRDLPDVMIATVGRDAGCDRTVTFDRRAITIPGMVLLAPPVDRVGTANAGNH